MRPNCPRVSLASLPTPIEPLARLSAALGGPRIFIKRDDLTGLAGRFGIRDLLESVLDPSKVISDQYAGVLIETSDGRAIAGRIVNLNDDSLMLMTNMLKNLMAEISASKEG